MSMLFIIRILECHPRGLPSSISFQYSFFPLLSLEYIQAIGLNVLYEMQIAKGNHTWVYAKVLYAHFGFHLTFIYIEEEVWYELGKVDKSILQLSFHDNEGQWWLLPPGRYRAFELNAAFMVASTDLVS